MKLKFILITLIAVTPALPALGAPMDILNDAYYHVDFSGNSDGGASRGELVLTKEDKPSGYSLSGPGGSLDKTATLGSTEYRMNGSFLLRASYRPDGADYSGADADFSHKAGPSADTFSSGWREVFTRTAVDGETDIFTCGGGTPCLTRKAHPWGDEYFSGGRLILLRAACPGGDVFYNGEGERLLVRVAGPGGDKYYRQRLAPALPDIAVLLDLPGDAAAWRAALFDIVRGKTGRRIIWPIPPILN